MTRDYQAELNAIEEKINQKKLELANERLRKMQKEQGYSLTKDLIKAKVENAVPYPLLKDVGHVAKVGGKYVVRGAKKAYDFATSPSVKKEVQNAVATVGKTYKKLYAPKTQKRVRDALRYATG